MRIPLMTKRSRLRTAILPWMLLASFCFCGCNGQGDEAAPIEGDTATKTISEKAVAPSSEPGPAAVREMVTSGSNPYPLPDGDRDAVVAFVRRLATEPVSGNTPQERQANLQFMMASRLAAADMLLAKADADEETRREARQARLDSLRVLAFFDTEQIETWFRREAQQMIDSDDLAGSLFGRRSLLMLESYLLSQGNIQNGEPILNQLEQLLKHSPDFDAAAFSTVEGAIVALQNQGFGELAKQGVASTRARVAELEDHQELQERLATLEQQLPLLEITALIQQLAAGDTEVADSLVTQASKLLEPEENRDGEFLSVIAEAAQMLEFSGQLEQARAMVDSIDKAFSAHEDTTLANLATQTTRTARVRLDLVGKPMDISGVLLNGAAFDWSQYRGKVVLVDFWATWCIPCLREVPNLKENYERYHDAGFEVVGVNLDDDLVNLDQYLKRSPLPWKTVVSEDESTMGFENPNARRYGVDTIPFVVLVDRDGTVAAIHVRGEKLDQELKQRLGDAATPGG